MDDILKRVAAITGQPFKAPKQSRSNFDDLFEKHGTENGVDPDLLRSMTRQESSFNPKARSHKNAQGLMQLIPETAQRFGVADVWDPDQNIRGGAKYMRWLLDEFGGDVDKALAGYNAGEGAVKKYKGIPPYRETQDYVKKIRSNYQGPGYLKQFKGNDADLFGGVDRILNAATASDPVLDSVKRILGQPTPTNPTGGNAPVPEMPTTIEQQLISLRDANSPKAGVLITDPGQDALFKDQVSGFKRVQTPQGILYVNPTKAKAMGVTDYANSIPALIGKVEPNENTAAGPTVLTTDAQGNELSASRVSSPEATDAQMQVDAQSYPQAANSQVVDAQDVVKKRDDDAALREEQIRVLGHPIDTLGGTSPADPAYADFLEQTGLPDSPESQKEFETVRQTLAKPRPVSGLPERQYTKREIKPGDKYFEFEQTGDAGNDLKYLGMSDDKHYAKDGDGDEYELQIDGEKGSWKNITPVPAKIPLQGGKVLTRTDSGTYTDEQGVEYTYDPSQPAGKQIQKMVSPGSQRLRQAVESVRGAKTQTPQGQPSVSIPRQAGRANENFRTVAGEYTPTTNENPEEATINAVIQVGRQHDITPQQVREWAAARHKDGIGIVGENFKPGVAIQVPFSVISEIKGEDATRYDIRSEQAEARTAPGVGVDLEVSPDEAYRRLGYRNVGEDAEWLKSNAGKALIAVSPIFSTLSKATRDAIGSELAGVVLGGGGDTARTIAGLTRLANAGGLGPVNNSLYDAVQSWADSIAASTDALRAGTRGDDGIVSTIVKVSDPSVYSRLVLLSALPGGIIAGMTLEHATQSAGRKDDWAEVGKQAAKGALIGTVFPVAQRFGGAIKYGVGSTGRAGTVAQVTGETVGIAFGTQQVEKAFGTPDDEATQAGIVNALFHLMTKGGRTLISGKTVRATTPEGKEIHAAVTPEGEVRLLKGKPPKDPDIELRFNEKTGMYEKPGDATPVRAKEEAYSVGNRGNRIETKTPEPRQLEEFNPQRIETPDPQAVQRAGKVIDALRNKQEFSTIEEISKAAKVNRTFAEDVVMTLYGAGMVELLPGNRVRLIADAPAVKSTDLFERAKTYGQTPETPAVSKPQSQVEPRTLAKDKLAPVPDESVLTSKEASTEAVSPKTVANKADGLDVNQPDIQTETAQKYEQLPEQKPQEAPVEKPKAKVITAERPDTAKLLQVFTERGTKASIEPKVIDAKDILTSLDEGYPAEFQPRDRSRIASRAQISEIANKLNPEFLGDSPKASDGRPLVVPVEMPDGSTKYAVISGNGRTAAIREAYSAENEPSQKYREFASSKGGMPTADGITVASVADYAAPGQQLKFNQGIGYEAVRLVGDPELIELIQAGSRMRKAMRGGTNSGVSQDRVKLLEKKFGVNAFDAHTAAKELASANRSRDVEKIITLEAGKGSAKSADLNQPVYVGILDPKEIGDLAEFAREANESSVATMSATEQARADAERLTPEIMARFVPADDGSIHTGANRDFTRAFLDAIGTNEQARLVMPDGSLNQDGVNRVRNAIFAKAFGETEKGQQAIQRMAESTNDSVKNVTTAMLGIAGPMASYKEAAKSGTRHGEYEISNDVAAAVAEYAKLKSPDSKFKDLEEYISQGNLFGTDTTPFQTRMMQVFDANKRSPKAMRTLFVNFLDAADRIGDPNQVNLFGESSNPDVRSLFEGVVNEYERSRTGEVQGESAGLFKDQGVRPRPTGDQAGTESTAEARRGEEKQPRTEAVKEEVATVPETVPASEIPANQPEGKPIPTVLRSVVRRAKKDATDEEIAEFYGLDVNEVKKLRAVTQENVGKFGQTSHYIRKALSPDDAGTLINKLAKQVVPQARIHVNNPLFDRQGSINAILDTIATDAGKLRSSELEEGDWTRILQTWDLPEEFNQIVSEALDHQADWFRRRQGFREDPGVATLMQKVAEIAELPGGLEQLAKVEWGNQKVSTLPADLKKQVRNIGKQYGLSEEVTKNTFLEAVRRTASEELARRNRESGGRADRGETTEAEKTDQPTLGDFRFAFGQTDLFGNPVTEIATQDALFDFKPVAPEHTPQNVDPGTFNFLVSLRDSANKQIARDADALVQLSYDAERQANLVPVVEDAATALDLFARSVHTKTPIDDMLRQKWMGVEAKISPRADEFARAMASKGFPQLLNRAVSEAKMQPSANTPTLGDVRFMTAWHGSPHTVYIAFESEQIKSAIGNRGTFDPNDPNILYSKPDIPGTHFADVVDKYFDGNLKRNSNQVVMNSPDVLKRLAGSRTRYVVMNENVLHKVTTGKHVISKENLKALPAEIENPVAVFKSTRNDSKNLIFLTSLKDSAGDPVVVVLKPNLQYSERKPGGDIETYGIDVITSAYGKEQRDIFDTWTKDGLLRYANKEKTREWLDGYGTDLPWLDRTIQRDNSKILTEADFVNRNDLHNDLPGAAQLTREINRLADNPKLTPELLAKTAKAKVDGDAVLTVNPAGAVIINKAIADLVNQKAPTSLGMYGNSRIAGPLVNQLLKTSKGNPEYTKFAEIVNDAFKKTGEHRDLTIVVATPDSVAVSKFTRQEELGHRANARTGIRSEFTTEVAAIPALEKGIKTLNKKGYANIKIVDKVDEAFAKSLRDDAESELGISDAEKYEIWDALRNGLDNAGVTDSYIRHAELQGTEFERYAKDAARKPRQRALETQPERTGEIDLDSQSGRQVREARLPDSRPFADRDTDRFAKLQRTGLLPPDRGQAESLITAKEAAFITRNAGTDTALARDLKDEVLYARGYEQAKGVALDILNAPRAIKASTDLSAAGRQGLILVPANPVIAGRAFIKQLHMIPPKKGKEAYEQFKRDLDLHPAIELAEESGLFLSSLQEGKISGREEVFMSRLLGDDPYFSRPFLEKPRMLVTYPVRASERAYVTFLDDLRINVFSKLAREIGEFNARRGREHDIEQFKGLAKFINYATGRGDLGMLNNAAPMLNTIFFAPRYWMSRLQVMNPLFYGKLPPGARKAAMKNMAAFIGSVGLIMLFLKLAGFDVEFGDEENPDLLKLRLGNYRYDMTAGLIGHFRYVARMVAAAAGAKNERDKRPAVDRMTYMTSRYVRSKLSPVPSAAYSAAAGKDFIGEPTSLTEESQKLIVPISVDNFFDAANAEGLPGILKTVPEFFGIGSSRYRGVEELRGLLDKERSKLTDSSTPAERKEIQRRIKIWQNKIAQAKKDEIKQRQAVVE